MKCISFIFLCMKRILIFSFLILFTFTISGQSVSGFLFPEYQDALIFYKDGRRFGAPVNFDLQAGHFLFIDAKDKEAKQFAYPEKISFLQIDSRNFLLSEGEAVEVLQANPLFQVAYSGNLRRAPKNLTYGGTTQTAAVDTYSGYSGNATLSSQRQSGNKVVVGISKRYTVKIGKKTRRFNNEKTFLKILPEHQREKIKKYIRTNNIDFDNVEQVFDLYKYIINNIPKT